MEVIGLDAQNVEQECVESGDQYYCKECDEHYDESELLDCDVYIDRSSSILAAYQACGGAYPACSIGCDILDDD